MESTRPIRALVRGLDALTILNTRTSATVSEVALEVKLPRTTVYRVLETLCGAGLAVRDAADDRYRLTPAIGSLSDGFQEDSWVIEAARPRLRELARELVWPVSIATRTGEFMQIRDCTDHMSPLCAERFSAGSRFPLLTSALGRVVLAHISADERAALFTALAQSTQPEARLARNPVELSQHLADIFARGFATSASSRRASDDFWVVVPVLMPPQWPAALGVRMASRAISPSDAQEQFLPSLRACAEAIGAQCAAAVRVSSDGHSEKVS